MNPSTPDAGLPGRLLAAGLLNAGQLELAATEQRRRGMGLISVVAELGFAAPEAISEFLATEAGTRPVDLVRTPPDPNALRLLPLSLARRLRVIPIRQDGGVLLLATADPFNIVTLDLVRDATGLELDVVTAPERQILSTLDRLEASTPTIQESIERIAEREALPETPVPIPGESPAVGAPVIALVQQLISRAVSSGASDLHLEPQERMVQMRLRVDGVLRPDVLIPKSMQAAVTSRLKLIGNLDITETRLPQDGRATVVVDRRPVNLRLSSLPTRFGESIVIRILHPGDGVPRLAELGLSAELEKLLRETLCVPHGAMLVTGPTGSGKTTTLYAILEELNRPDTGIFTLEDPVEMTLPGVRQTQIQEDLGLTFGRALRSLLRQDPDVILVGETRDSETATLMIRAALTGHRVFSTLHTNDAAGAIPRLLDMGVEPCLLPDSLIAVMAQRLVRRLCIRCRRPNPDCAQDSFRIGGLSVDGPHAAPWNAGKCEECRQTGFLGRLALFEILRVHEPFHDAVMRRAPHSEFLRIARGEGMRTLFEDGVRHVISGSTTFSEVIEAAGRN